MGTSARKSETVGSLVLDRSCGMVAGREIGKLRVRIGSSDPKVLQSYKVMVDSLVKQNRADVLLALKTREKDFATVFYLWESGKLNTLSVILAGDRLETVLMDWVDTSHRRKGEERAESTKKSYRNSFTQLLKLANDSATIKDIPDLLARYREQCVKYQHFSPFNNCHTALMAFARATQDEKEDSDLYRAIRRIERLSTTRKRELRGLQVWEVKEVMKTLTPEMAQHVWNLFATGMRLSEYADGDWSIEADRITINGTKNPAARRFVPKVDGVVKNYFPRSTFVRKFRETTECKLKPNDLRGSYQQMLDMCIPSDYRIDRYEGHVSTSVKKGYRSHPVEPHLRADAKSIAAYIAANSEPPKDDDS